MYIRQLSINAHLQPLFNLMIYPDFRWIKFITILCKLPILIREVQRKICLCIFRSTSHRNRIILCYTGFQQSIHPIYILAILMCIPFSISSKQIFIISNRAPTSIASTNRCISQGLYITFSTTHLRSPWPAVYTYVCIKINNCFAFLTTFSSN